MGPDSEIAKWYSSKAVFVTGATGFMGKVLVEKLLRSCPEIGPIFVLVRAKKGILCRDRVEDMATSPLFDTVRAAGVSPSDRIIGIPGDINLKHLGISDKNRRLLQDTVSVVFHVAVTARFDEPLQLAMATNVDGTKAVLELCKGVKNLCALVHVSTAYTNCNLSTVQERVYPPPSNPYKILQFVEDLDEFGLSFMAPRVLSGHPNTYTFTKALAEDVVASYSMELPIVIVRPSIVSASWKEPEPGWVDNFNEPTAIVVGTAKGLPKTVYGRKDMSVDLIPVDVCINFLIAAAWEIGTREGPKLVPDVLVYNCVSGPFTKITWNDFLRYMYPRATKYAISDVFTAPEISMTKSRIKHVLVNFVFQSLPATLADICVRSLGESQILQSLMYAFFRFNRYQSNLNHMTESLEFFTTHEWKFHGDNVEQLKKRLSPADREAFDFDMTKMDWNGYADSYMLGVRRNVMKERDDTIPRAESRIDKLRLLSKSLKIGLLSTVGLLVLKMTSLPTGLEDLF